MRRATEKTGETHLVEVGRRPGLSEDERDDAKQVLALALSGIQRERAAADQCFVRGRNYLAFTAALYTAVQAAFLANLAREVNGKVLLDAGERNHVLIPALAGALFLATALLLLVFWLDRPRAIAAVGAGELEEAWLDPNNKHPQTPVLQVLTVRAIQEENAWAHTNKDRERARSWIGDACAIVGLAALAELVLIYIGLNLRGYRGGCGQIGPAIAG